MLGTEQATLARAMIERHAKYGRSQLAGEWAAIHQFRRIVLHRALENGDEERLMRLLASMFRNPISEGLVSFDYHEAETDAGREAFAETIGYCLAIWTAYTDQFEFECLDIPNVGQPVFGDYHGVQMMIDTPRHDYYAHKISKLLPDGGKVLEIGGGYGGMARQLLQYSDNIQITLCDLPETLYLAWYWLSRCTTRSVAWYDEDATADVLLLPAQKLEEAEAVDLVFAAHCLSEMDQPTVDGYVEWIRATQPRYFYHDSVHMIYAPQDGSSAMLYPETQARSFVPDPPYREVYRAPSIWRGVRCRYWEFLFERE